MKKLFPFLLLALVFGVFFIARDGDDALPEVAGEQIEQEKPEESPWHVQTYVVQEDDVFATALEQFSVSYADMLAIVSSTVETYDFTRIRVGQPLRYFTNKTDGSFAKLEYDVNSEDMVVVTKPDGAWEAERIAIPYDVTLKKIRGVIDESMYLSGLTAGMDDRLILHYAEVFAWTIDFATQVQSGDSFELVYEERTRNGAPAGTGNIRVASFTNVGKTFYAYLFENEEGDPAYYDENGEAMIKQFLKAPLSYSRISSGYSNSRFHPVIGRNTHHRAIDYAAPIGTPILAVGDGTVTKAGWNGGYGNFISLHHNEMYTTRYAHLSRIAVSAGTRVSQGDVIGYVGSTGWSTGPHLHYEIMQFGEFVNPLTIDLPPGEPVTEEKRDAFEQTKRELDLLFLTT